MEPSLMADFLDRQRRAPAVVVNAGAARRGACVPGGRRPFMSHAAMSATIATVTATVTIRTSEHFAPGTSA